MCAKIAAQKKTHVTELEGLRLALAENAAGVLSYLDDQETARKLLLTPDGPLATLGAKGVRRKCVLDLAIDLENIEFVAHRYCQGILDEKWMGRAPECGPVRLVTLESTWTLIAQAALSLLCLQVVPVQVNDLYRGGGEPEALRFGRLREVVRVERTRLTFCPAQLGLDATTAEAAALLSKYDADASGTLELAEFATFVYQLRAFQETVCFIP